MPIGTRSERIELFDAEKLAKVNAETLQLWKKYEKDMKLRELSEDTIYQYYSDLRQWWIYILDEQQNRCVTDLDEDDITDFLYFCKEQGNNSRRLKRRISSLAAFYKFLRKKKIITVNPMEDVSRPQKDTDIVVQTYLTPEQVTLMREKLAENFETAVGVTARHLALEVWVYGMLSLSTMARASAVSSIKWDQIDLEGRVINDVVEKEGYIVSLYFSNEVKELLEKLKAFRSEMQIEDNGLLFVTKSGGITDASVMFLWARIIGNLIGVSTLHPHDFRHSGATLLKNLGMELEDISKLLNHKGLDVTQKHYIKVDPKMLQQQKDKFDF